MEHGLFSRIKNSDEQGAHNCNADREKNDQAEQLAEQIFKSRDRFGQNRVDRPILDVLRNQTCRRDDREDGTEERHRAERNVFQDLEFLLKGEARHENGTPDEEKREYQNNIENLLAREVG